MIQIAIILVIVIGMSIVTPLLINCGRSRYMKLILSLIFCVYFAGNLYFTLLSRRSGSSQYFELQPFRVYGHLFENPTEEVTATGFAALFLQGTLPITGLILNILLYYPLGYLLPILFPKLKPKHVILIGCLCSIATEATQYILKIGWCETDDVIHNTLGTAIGVWIWHLQSKRLNKQNSNELPKE